jgi:EXLDI family protein
MSAKIYRTQKNNWAVYLVTISKASLLTDAKNWKKSGEYLENNHRAELFVADDPKDLEKKLPETLSQMLAELAQRDEKPIEYLDI